MQLHSSDASFSPPPPAMRSQPLKEPPVHTTYIKKHTLFRTQVRLVSLLPPQMLH